MSDTCLTSVIMRTFACLFFPSSVIIRTLRVSLFPLLSVCVPLRVSFFPVLSLCVPLRVSFLPLRRLITVGSWSYIGTLRASLSGILLQTARTGYVTEGALRASLSGTFLQTLLELVTPLKGHSVFISAHLSTCPSVSALRKLCVLIRLWK